MSGETLYAIACEMLRETNPYKIDIEDICYGSEERQKKLIDLIKTETSKYDNKFCSRTEENLRRVFECIEQAMLEYLESYPAVFSYKQRTRESFGKWLREISKKYSIANAKVILDNFAIPKNERDIGIAMLKMLHSREGVTYSEIAEELNIRKRGIQKDLVKISSSFYTGPGQAYEPLRLAGQPLHAEISLVKDTEKAEEKHFYTLNSVHPLVLLENITQLATLLKALSHQWMDQQDDISRMIGIDIWSQMSDYARNKIKDFFAFNDECLEKFIAKIDIDYPDDHACVFKTEKEIQKELEIEQPIEHKLSHMMKASGRTGTIILWSGETVTAVQIEPTVLNDGTKAYEVTDDNGNTMILEMNNIYDVRIN